MVKTLKNKRILVLLAIALLGFSAFPSVRVSANVKTYQNYSMSSLEEAYTSASSEDSDPPAFTPYKRTTFVYSDPTTYLDEYAFIASIPANVFRDEAESLYAAPIMYGESESGDYLLEDWKTYCDHWEGDGYLDFIGPYSEDYISEMKNYLGTENSASIVADNPYEYAAEIALRDWKNSSEAVIAPATTRFQAPEPLYGEYKGEFFNVTEDYMVSYAFGAKLGPSTYVDLVPPVESPHPYPNDTVLMYPVVHPGADQISVHFENITVEEWFDAIAIYDKDMNYITFYTGHLSDVWTPPVPGDTVYIVLITDYAISEWGFLADAYMWWAYKPPLPVIHRGEWLNFTVPANITGITIANVDLLNWTSAVGEVLLTCFLIDPDGNVVDYDFSPEYGDYTWMMWDVNERPRTTTENYTVAVYCHGFGSLGDFGLILSGELYGFSGKPPPPEPPGNLHSYTITVPENAKELDIWLSCNSTQQQASWLSMWLLDPEGNVFFPNYFESTDTEYPPAPIYISNLGRLNAPYPTPGNWTLIVEAPPTSPELVVEYAVEYRIQLYDEERGNYVEAAANAAVIASLKNAPLLYTKNNSLPEETVKALRILNVQNVTLADPAGIVSGVVKTAITGMGIDVTELTSLEEIISHIRGLSGETDLILTVPTGSFFAPAALAGAFHGAPVLTFSGEAKEIPTLADSTWAAQYYYHEFGGWSVYDMLLKAPPIHWMHELSEIWSRWIGTLNADAPGMESVLTVAPLVDVKPVFERAIQGIARAGRIPGENAEEDVAFINRAMLYPAIIYANPGYNVTMPTCVTYDYGIPDVASDIPPELVQPPDYKPPEEYIHSVNGWENTTKAMESRNFTVEAHVGKYEVFEKLNSGVAFWYHSNHGGLGFVWDYLPLGQGVIGLWYEDPPDPQPKRGYEYNMTTHAENASVPDQYNLYGYPSPDGAIYQVIGEPSSYAFGGEIDRWLGNIHSAHTVFMDCYIGGSMLSVTMMRHGAASVIGDMRTGLLIDADWFCVKYTQEVMTGKTLGEAFVTAVTKTGYVYPKNYFNMTLFKPAWVYNYTIMPGVEEPWYALPYVEDGSNAFVLYGDPDITIVDPTASEPEALDPSEISVLGHDPDHVTRGISVSLTTPLSGTYVSEVTTLDWAITLQNTVLESCLLCIDGATYDVTDLTSYPWDTTEPGVLDGNHTITLAATDLLGNADTTEIWVIVDNTTPIAEIRKPTENTYENATCTIDVYGYDANLDLMKLYINENLETQWTEAGPQTYAWDTTTWSEGTYTIKIIVSDEADWSVEDTVAVTVDRTEPAVSITDPAEEADLAGAVTITFTANDPNLKTAELIIDDNIIFDVTGKTSQEWDTTEIGDGIHTIKLVACDKAGNKNQTSITVTTVNVKLEVEATRNLYLGIGTPIGFIIGAIIIYAIVRKRP